jgi:3-dehydro-L-gulonate 2-dehydrogenase
MPFEELLRALAAILTGRGMEPERAALCAHLFAETDRDGVYTHGVNRFPRFVRMIDNGAIDLHAIPAMSAQVGSLERWDGRQGPGNLNAYACMGRAIEMARQHGIGCVALSNTTHWMRGGSYGWQAAEAAMIGICWTNTLPNLPPWGDMVPRLGNNPLVIAVPRNGGHVVLDMAMSQFSYGTLTEHRKRGKLLPVDGGFDVDGNPTRDPGAIERSLRPLPIGYWKGSGLSLVLDMVAAMMAGGKATHQIPPDPEREIGICQMFVAMNTAAFSDAGRIAESVIASLGEVRYPGARILRIRAENMALGIPVDDAIWEEVKAVARGATGKADRG